MVTAECFFFAFDLHQWRALCQPFRYAVSSGIYVVYTSGTYLVSVYAELERLT